MELCRQTNTRLCRQLDHEEILQALVNARKRGDLKPRNPACICGAESNHEGTKPRRRKENAMQPDHDQRIELHLPRPHA